MTTISAAMAPTQARRDQALARRINLYAAKFLAETARAEPPVHLEPTDANLAAILGRCGRPARAEEYPAIREALKRQAVAPDGRLVDTAVVMRALRARLTHEPALAVLDALEAGEWRCVDVRPGGIVVFNHPITEQEIPTPEYVGKAYWPSPTYSPVRGLTLALDPSEPKLCHLSAFAAVPWAGAQSRTVTPTKAVAFVVAEVTAETATRL